MPASFPSRDGPVFRRDLPYRQAFLSSWQALRPASMRLREKTHVLLLPSLMPVNDPRRAPGRLEAFLLPARHLLGAVAPAQLPGFGSGKTPHSAFHRLFGFQPATIVPTVCPAARSAAFSPLARRGALYSAFPKLCQAIFEAARSILLFLPPARHLGAARFSTTSAPQRDCPGARETLPERPVACQAMRGIKFRNARQFVAPPSRRPRR